METLTTSIIIVLYLVLLFGVSAWAQKRQKKMEAQGGTGSFLMASKSLPTVLVAFMMAGAGIGSINTTGIAEQVQTAGLSGACAGFAGAVALIILGVFGGRRMRALPYNTMPSMAKAYCGETTRWLLSMGGLVIAMAITALQFVGGGAMLSSMFPDYITYNMGVVITALVFFVIAALGGMMGASLSNVVNMIGNYLLIQGHLGFPAMGIAGAALATVFGTVVACIMSICSLIPKDNFVSIPYIIKERVRITLEPAKNMAKIASSVFIEQVFMRTGFLLVSIMAARLGTSAYAAHQVAMNVMNLSFSFGDGMQVAAVALCGRSLGEKRPDLAVMYGTICQRIGNMISIVLSILYLALGNWYFHLYFVEEDIIAMGARIMQVMTVIVLLQISQVIYMGCLRGAGDVVFTTCASTLSITIVRPSCAYLFCYVLEIGVVGIWLGIVCDQIVRVCLTNWRFKSGKWTKIKI